MHNTSDYCTDTLQRNRHCLCPTAFLWQIRWQIQTIHMWRKPRYAAMQPGYDHFETKMPGWLMFFFVATPVPQTKPDNCRRLPSSDRAVLTRESERHDVLSIRFWSYQQRTKGTRICTSLWHHTILSLEPFFFTVPSCVPSCAIL